MHCSMTLEYTTSPSEIFCRVFSNMFAVRKASAKYRLVGTIFQCVLEPLLGHHLQQVHEQGREVLGEAAAALKTHRGPLAGVNLFFLIGLFHLLEVHHQPDIHADLCVPQSLLTICMDVPKLTRTGSTSISTFRVYVSPVMMKALLNLCLFCHHLVKQLHLLVIPFKELQETGLRASISLYMEAQVVPNSLEALQVHAEILNPEAEVFPNLGQLDRLKIHETQGGQVGMFLSKISE